ncbi:MAG: DUF815 domain-containing protein [Pacificimonas sp.]
MDETALSKQLSRIAEALERLAPAPRLDDLTRFPAYRWSHDGLCGLPRVDHLPLDRIAAADRQKKELREAACRHAAGRPAHDVLLWGARGMGKSLLVRSVAADVGLTLVEVDASRIGDLDELFDHLGRVDRRFWIFVDDLGVDEAATLRQLRSVLDGTVRPRPGNVHIVVTSNRRHLVERTLADNEAAASVNARDTLDDKLALAERFGLSLGFHNCSQDEYLAICRALAAPTQIDERAAINFATKRGARSGRIAAHYVTELQGAD